MKLPKLLVYFFVLILFLVAVLILDKYRVNSSSTDLSKKEEKLTEVISPDLKKKIEDFQTKYNNPKIASLRQKDWKRVGKVFMQYDNKEDKTYFWLTSDLLKKGDYSLVLVNDKLNESKGRNLSIGKISFDENGAGYVFYEFEKKGDWYDYLKVLVLDGDKEILEANFNEKLN